MVWRDVLGVGWDGVRVSRPCDDLRWWRIDWLTHWPIDSWVGCLVDRTIDRFVDGLIDRWMY